MYEADPYEADLYEAEIRLNDGKLSHFTLGRKRKKHCEKILSNEESSLRMS